MPEQNPKKVVLLGAAEVGKTAIVSRLTRNFFPYRYEPTVEDVYRHQVALLGNKQETIELVDTTGADGPDGENVRNMHAVFADAFIVVFSVKSRTSYERARQFLNRIEQLKPKSAAGGGVPVLLVGNQADDGEETEGHDDSAACNAERQVSMAEGEELAEHPVAGDYLEISALANRDVNRLMPTLSAIFRRGKKPKKGLARLADKARGFFGANRDAVVAS